MANPFDRGEHEAQTYDAWYDDAQGRDILAAEVDALRALLEGAPRPWVDVGTGTGRFGAALGVDVGLDPATSMLTLGRGRIPAVARGKAEALPFRTGSIGVVVVAAVLEFLDSPEVALLEFERVLAPEGRVVIGFFPRGGSCAREYVRRGRDPASVFHSARFFSVEDLRALGLHAGLTTSGARSVWFDRTGATRRATDDADDTADFAGLLFTNTGAYGSRRGVREAP